MILERAVALSVALGTVSCGGREGTLVGVDASEGLLAQARVSLAGQRFERRALGERFECRALGHRFERGALDLKSRGRNPLRPKTTGQPFSKDPYPESNPFPSLSNDPWRGESNSSPSKKDTPPPKDTWK